jgi:esterase/lipase superfamily enzyme
MPEGDSLHQIRQMGIVLGVPEHDACRPDNERLADVMNQKGVSYWFDYRPGASHDWPIWRDMLPLYLSRVNY